VFKLFGLLFGLNLDVKKCTNFWWKGFGLEVNVLECGAFIVGWKFSDDQLLVRFFIIILHKHLG
jgi:hypothetical protein